MLALTTDQRTALEARAVMRRMFIWVEATDPVTGDPEPVGFWDDVGDVELDGKTYHGSGSVISISPLTAKGDLTIPGLELTLSGIDITAEVLARAKTIAQTPITVSVGLFNPADHELIPPLFPYFVGYIDDCTIRTPAEGGDSTMVFTCESASRALTRISTATRSNASEVERDADDAFYSYTGAQRDKPLYFGRAAPGAPNLVLQGLRTLPMFGGGR